MAESAVDERVEEADRGRTAAAVWRWEVDWSPGRYLPARTGFDAMGGSLVAPRTRADSGLTLPADAAYTPAARDWFDGRVPGDGHDLHVVVRDADDSVVAWFLLRQVDRVSGVPGASVTLACEWIDVVAPDHEPPVQTAPAFERRRRGRAMRVNPAA
jgi:hypothetical protein